MVNDRISTLIRLGKRGLSRFSTQEGARAGHAHILPTPGVQMEVHLFLCLGSALFCSDPILWQVFPLVAKIVTNDSKLTFHQLPTLAERDSHLLVPVGSNTYLWNGYVVSLICSVPIGNEKEVNLEKDI